MFKRWTFDSGKPEQSHTSHWTQKFSFSSRWGSCAGWTMSKRISSCHGFSANFHFDSKQCRRHGLDILFAGLHAEDWTNTKKLAAVSKYADMLGAVDARKRTLQGLKTIENRCNNRLSVSKYASDYREYLKATNLKDAFLISTRLRRRVESPPAAAGGGAADWRRKALKEDRSIEGEDCRSEDYRQRCRQIPQSYWSGGREHYWSLQWAAKYRQPAWRRWDPSTGGYCRWRMDDSSPWDKGTLHKIRQRRNSHHVGTKTHEAVVTLDQSDWNWTLAYYIARVCRTSWIWWIQVLRDNALQLMKNGVNFVTDISACISCFPKPLSPELRVAKVVEVC